MMSQCLMPHQKRNRVMSISNRKSLPRLLSATQENYGRSGIKYSLLKLHQRIRLKPSGNFEPNLFRKDCRITCSLQI
uniref:Uncharacterized protein n=1 Tax=Oryza rufipogon TaxID=4529 RepID=A0A0E0PH21_ORYRU